MNNLSMNNFSQEQSPHIVFNKGLIPIIQQQAVPLVEENMSNLTSASGEAGSVSSNPQSFVSPNSHPNPNPTPNPNPAKKKRNLPGNPGILEFSSKLKLLCRPMLVPFFPVLLRLISTVELHTYVILSIFFF
jgi:hypothetical protein